MLYGGAARSADPPLLGSPGSVLLVSNFKVIFGCVFEVPPLLRRVWGNFFGPASSAHLGPRFSLLDTSTYLGFWKGVGTSCVCGVKKAIGSPNRLMMLALGGLLGAKNAL